jgi:hypothetical protein
MQDEPQRLTRLLQMASMVLDARAQKLRAENATKEALQSQLAALEARPVEQQASWCATETSAFGYEQWAARRRAEINLKLAAQKARCLQAEAEARLAFGRKAVLGKMRER